MPWLELQPTIYSCHWLTIHYFFNQPINHNCFSFFLNHPFNIKYSEDSDSNNRNSHGVSAGLPSCSSRSPHTQACHGSQDAFRAHCVQELWDHQASLAVYHNNNATRRQFFRNRLRWLIVATRAVTFSTGAALKLGLWCFKWRHIITYKQKYKQKYFSLYAHFIKVTYLTCKLIKIIRCFFSKRLYVNHGTTRY